MRGKHWEEDASALDEIVELSLLYDFYGALLKDRKREIFEDYVIHDLSLGEIAENRGISRQGAYDSLRRCRKELMEYESRLGLVERFGRVKEKVRRIQKEARILEGQEEGAPAEDEASRLRTIERIAGEILEEF